MSEHTPTPWKVAEWVTGHRAADCVQFDGKRFVAVGRLRNDVDGGTDLVAGVFFGREGRVDAEQDATFIVQACNAHEGAVRLANAVVEYFGDEPDSGLRDSEIALRALARFFLEVAQAKP